MKILITGGAGFVGSHLTKRLLDSGNEVTVIDSLVTGQQENIQPFEKYPNFKFFQLVIEGADFISLFTNGDGDFDRIYHLACPTGVPNIELLGDEILAACSTGTLNVLRLAVRTGAKLLFTSSSEIYGEPKIFPQRESYTGNVDPIGPRANYEEGKRFSETLVNWFIKKYNLDAKIVRLFNTYGPNMSLRDQRVIPRFASQALSGQQLTVQGDGSQRRTLCYISDLIRGLELVMEKGEAGKAYNLGSDKEISILELARLIVALSGSSSQIQFVYRPDHDHNARKPTLNEVKALGWKPRVDLYYGLKQTLDHFKTRLYFSSNGRVENGRDTGDGHQTGSGHIREGLGVVVKAKLVRLLRFDWLKK